MIEWGSLELPELDYWEGGREVGKHHAATGLIHRRTGLGATHATLRYEERGQNRELLIYAPPGEEWLLRLRITGANGLHGRIAAHLGLRSLLTELTPKEQVNAKMAFLRDFGQEYFCQEFIPEPGFEMPVWTDTRRDAVVMMIFWLMEASMRNPKLSDPYPSTVTFKGDVPDLFLGTYRNPVWERLMREAPPTKGGPPR